MSGIFSVQGLNLALNGIGANMISIHDEDPTEVGTVGMIGRPIICAFNPATAGRAMLASPVSFDVPKNTTVSHYAVWRDSLLVAYGALENEQAYPSDGIFTMTAMTLDLTRPPIV